MRHCHQHFRPPFAAIVNRYCDFPAALRLGRVTMVPAEHWQNGPRGQVAPAALSGITGVVGAEGLGLAASFATPSPRSRSLTIA